MKTSEIRVIPADLLQRNGLKKSRQWKNRKRRELRELCKAFDKFRIGCYYTPSGTNGEVGRVGEILDEWKRQFSQKEWGR